MEIGGFITEGAEIVNHDNTLSGNGTVDSPLGVVPGYNETVLWSGTYSGTVSTANFITLSERPDNFETIEITNGPGYYSKYRYDGKSNTWSFMQTYADSTACTVYAVRLSVDKANKKVFCANANFFKTKANAVIDWANQSTRSVGENMITKIVGINRLSASN